MSQSSPVGSAPPPELDPGTVAIRDLDLNKIGRSYTYEGASSGDVVEHWVAFDGDAKAAIIAGAVSLDWAGGVDGDWSDAKKALEDEFPGGGLKVAIMNVHYQTPPSTATAATGATNTQFTVLCGDPADPEAQGGLFREALPNNGGYIDHWRLYSGYEAPHPTSGGGTILKFASVTAGRTGTSLVLLPLPVMRTVS
jgi:hypothetical protein